MRQQAHSKVKSGADFPSYTRDIKQLGVRVFETWLMDCHTVFYGSNNFQTSSKEKYDAMPIFDHPNKEHFIKYLKTHQHGKTDYLTFCSHCAETGIEKWKVNQDTMSSTYFDIVGNEVFVERIPG